MLVWRQPPMPHRVAATVEANITLRSAMLVVAGVTLTL
jgi:hypothetical protein